MPISFLKNWTINLTKLPTYAIFRGKFELDLDYQLLLSMGQSTTHPMLNDDRKQLLLPIINAINKQTNILTVEHNNRFKMGRFYPDKSISPIVISRYMKHTLFEYLGWIDLDMVKGHPTILVNVARLANLDLKCIKRYIEDCDGLTREIQQYYSPQGDNEPIISPDRIKNIFNRIIYGGGMTSWFADVETEDGIELRTNEIHPFIKEFTNECHQVMDLIYTNNPEMVKLLKKATDHNEFKTKSRIMSYFLGTVENENHQSYYLTVELCNQRNMHWNMMVFVSSQNLLMGLI